jgi:hypothetical protein
MIPMLEPILNEIRQEAITTKRILERVPADKLSWKPLPKSMWLGQLALHVAKYSRQPGDACAMQRIRRFTTQFRAAASSQPRRDLLLRSRMRSEQVALGCSIPSFS